MIVYGDLVALRAFVIVMVHISVRHTRSYLLQVPSRQQAQAATYICIDSYA